MKNNDDELSMVIDQLNFINQNLTNISEQIEVLKYKTATDIGREKKIELSKFIVRLTNFK